MEGTPEARYSGMGSLDTLQQFADLTGGPAKTTNDIGTAVRQAMNDVRTSYLLGYYPPSENWDGKFHKLRLTCGRKGVRLQAKSGYYAWDEGLNDEEESLRGALASPFDAAEIGVRAALSGVANGGRAMHIDFRIDASDLRINQEGERYTAHLAMQAVGYAADGKMERTTVMPLDVNLSTLEYAKALKDGIASGRDVAMTFPAQKVRLLVFDRGVHAVGSLTIPVKTAQ